MYTGLFVVSQLMHPSIENRTEQPWGHANREVEGLKELMTGSDSFQNPDDQGNRITNLAWINSIWKFYSFSVVSFTHIQASNNRSWVLQKETPQKQFHYFGLYCESMTILNPYSIDKSVTAADGSTLLIKQAWLILLMLLFCYRPSFFSEMHQKLKPGLPGNGDFLQQAHHYLYINNIWATYFGYILDLPLHIFFESQISHDHNVNRE